MRKILILFACVLSFSFLSCKDKPVLPLLEQGFRLVPDSIRIGCYWYWISDNISKEGVVKDLHAMKQAGITRAFIGNIGLDDIPFGKVKIFTDEWWDIIHTALKTATELNIEIGIFNSPGWSQSGGPWVKPEQSMRYLATTDTLLVGGNAFSYTIPEYTTGKQLVKVLAYPTNTEVYTIEKTIIPNNLPEVIVPSDDSKTIRSFVFRTKDYIQANVQVQAKINGAFETLRTLDFDRSKYEKNVGFDPYAPIVVSLPETKTTEFRVCFDRPMRASKNPSTLTFSSAPVVERYPEQTLAKMFQRPLPFWETYMWAKQDWYQPVVEGAIPQDKIIDLSAQVAADGSLKWDVPNGNWTVSFLEMKTTEVTNSPATPEATGLEIDKMSKKHVAYHFDSFLGEIIKRVPEADRKSFKVAVQDSWETGGQNWTDDMGERFKEVYGYDPTPYLPTLSGKVVGNEDVSSRFLWDLRRLISDRVAYDYVGGLSEICHQYGITTWLESYGHWGFPGEFLQYGGQSDEVGGEFWSAGELGDIENRDASSCAHIYGKTKVWSESCTSGGPNYGLYPAVMKSRVDRFFTEGINATLLHLYIHQPYEDKFPGMSAWFGNDFNRKNTWFNQMDLFVDYLRRSNLVLQQGKYVADVAYFIGEDAPKMRGITDPELPKGYSFDYINAEVLMTRSSVKDGYLTLPDGMRYRLLVLPKQKSMRPELLKKISELVNQGLAVYGDTPEYSPSLQNYPEADKEVQQLGNELFAKNEYGKGKVFKRDTKLEEALLATGAKPDFKTSQEKVSFIHRSLGSEGDIYFISNQGKGEQSFEAEFRVNGNLAPQLWNPITGEIRTLPQYTKTADGISLPIKLDEIGCAFIVFRKGKTAVSNEENFPAPQKLLTVDTPWNLAFMSDTIHRGPANEIVFNTLTDLKDNADPAIKFYSGDIQYATAFTFNDLPEGKEIYLDLGKVMVTAKVMLNGRYVGGVWTTPYRLNVTDFVKQGENQLVVTVVNNWQNRLIGDLRLPEKERKLWTMVNHFRAETELQSSGLLGPVEVQAIDYKIVQK
ncbi:MAG: glycoside hydrolase family 2 [Dysgonamonadaceae bacterium]|jgi:hypothetical protein|nr:glycoside hydrolase family 2 [Dysgonamonadaceae bacterium]